MVGRKGGGMARFVGHHERGGRPSPTDSLRRPADVPKEGVGFRAAHQPRHSSVNLAYGGRAAQCIPTGPLQGVNVPDPWESGHWSSSQVGWDRSPRP